MESNFEFLLKDQDTALLYNTVTDAEDLYKFGKFSNELEALRKVAENVARMIIDFAFITMPKRSTFNDCLLKIKTKHLVPNEILQKFYDLKDVGNSAAHTLHKYGKGEALEALNKMYDILAWFSLEYAYVRPKQVFVEPKKENLYQTAERKVIYVQTADNKDGGWPKLKDLEKIGDTTINDLEADNRPNSEDLRAVANRRIKQYMHTSGVPYVLQWAELAYRKQDKTWFRDYDVHEVLKRSGIKRSDIVEGEEWFKTDLETAKKAILAVKEGRESIDAPISVKENKIQLRPEQKSAVKKTRKAFKKYPKMLWNAKMRFGKTLSALELVKEEKYHHVLIMTHRPVVDEGWFEDFKKIGMPQEGYLYGSKKTGESIEYLLKSDAPYVYFASLQDLGGSESVGGKVKDKNNELLDNDWDLVIIDEAHEGSQTELAKAVLDRVTTEDHTKILELSGTPFNLLDQYKEEQVYTWDYVMEQEAKYNWNNEHPNEPNPYASLPKVSMYTFEMNHNFKDEQFINLDKRSFNFKEFFRVDEQGKFVYEGKVKQFLRNITSPEQDTNYPFSTRAFRNRLRHTLWILPGIKEANALEDLLKIDPVFKEYNIVNVVRGEKNDDKTAVSEGDIAKVNNAMKPDPAETKSITLTVRKMTTGVTIKPWTGVVFLSNTNSATQYLQAAFRAQTPYSSPTFGEKTNCYIFDFAPDRALTVMAEAKQLNTGVGKRTTTDQKDQMRQLLNFLPIIGEAGQRMKRFSVDGLLTKLKRVYAEKAVRTGFDDDSLYSDELLMLDNVDLKDFNELKEIVGTTKSEKKKMEVNVNNQGLTDEEYDTATKAQKKAAKDRTPEELAAIEKMKELKKQRKTMISILRSISIRIPMMIYGMNVDIKEDVDIHKFIRLVDDLSWKEFMPKGVTKELFKKFIKYYDADVFIEAGRIIRRKAKELDKLDPMERAEKLADIFSTFRNPDKETVLTPWRVVNMHLGKTLGGLNFYDSNYENPTQGAKEIREWRETEYTDKVFNRDAHVLEINSKTGLYPLYAALSIYYREYLELNNNRAGKFGFEDQLMIWQQVLRENIFVVAKTPMAKAITQRTLAGYLDLDTNIEFVNRIVEDTKKDTKAVAGKIKRLFGNMKFDVVIGNPPYTEKDGGAGASGTPVYQNFVYLAKSLSPKYITLITPSRWFVGGKGLDKFRDDMLNDKRIKEIYDFLTPQDVFPHTNIRGGVSFFLWDKKYDNSENGLRVVSYKKNNKISDTQRNLKIPDVDIFVRDAIGYKLVLDRFKALKKNNFSMYVSKRKPFGLDTSYNRKMSTSVKKMSNPIKCYGNDNKVGFIELNAVTQNKKYVNEWKVLTTRANNVGTELKDDNVNTVIAEPGSVCTETYLVIGAELSLDSNTAKNVSAYMHTKFFRFLHGLAKGGQDATSKTYALIPMQDFTLHSDINWTKSIKDIDQQLYKKYNLNADEIKFIEGNIQDMN